MSQNAQSCNVILSINVDVISLYEVYTNVSIFDLEAFYFRWESKSPLLLRDHHHPAVIRDMCNNHDQYIPACESFGSS